MKKTLVLQVRIAEDDKQRLDKLAEKEQSSVSDIIRSLIAEKCNPAAEVDLHDGWNDFGNLSVFAEDGKVKRGLYGDRTVYPYIWDGNVLNNVSDEKVSWFEKNWNSVSWR